MALPKLGTSVARKESTEEREKKEITFKNTQRDPEKTNEGSFRVNHILKNAR